MQITLALIIYALGAVSAIIGIIAWFLPNLTLGKKFAVFFVSIAFVIGCALVIGEVDGIPIFPAEPSFEENYEHEQHEPAPTLPVNGTDSTSEYEEPAEPEFAPDYRPGRENIYGNEVYINQGGRVCKQDEMYYIGTNSGIYKCDSDFSSFEKICDDEAIGINVVASELYYSAIDGIYSIRTDGADKKQLISLPGYAQSLQYFAGTLYYADPSDHHLYSLPSNGGSPKKINDDLLGSGFLLNEYSVYYLEWEANELHGLSSGENCSYVSANVFDGITHPVIEPEYIDEALWNEVYREYDDTMPLAAFPPATVAFDRSTSKIYYFVISSYGDESGKDGMHSFNIHYDDKEWLLPYVWGNYPCLVDGYVYYIFQDDESVPEGSMPISKFARYHIASRTNEVLGNPMSDSLNTCGFYPVNNTIIFNTFDSVWYKYNFETGSLEFLEVQ